MTSPPLPDPDPWLSGFRLGDWQVDCSGNRLLREDEVRPLRHKAMALLLLLARHAGRTVTRDQIVEAVWDGNHFVAPKAINTAIWTIRQALGDDPDAPRYLETIAKKGYRLIAPVSLSPSEVTPPTSTSVPLPAIDAPPPGPHPTGGRLPAWWSNWWWAATLVLLLGVAAGALRLAMRADPPVVAGAPSAPASLVPMVPKPLTHEQGVEYLGALSPDGKQLAFAWWRGRGGGELHLLRIDSPEAAPQPLAAGHGDLNSLAWAPDGGAIAFAALTGNGHCRVWLQPLPPGASPTAPRELAECAALATPSLAWSPDGRQITFSAVRDGAAGLFSIGPDGQNLQRLTTTPPAAMADHQPSWAPDGSHLAFVREDPGDGTRDLHEWRPGAGVRRLTNLKLHSVHGLAHAANGQDLVYSTTQQDARVLLRWQRADGHVVPLGVEGSAPVRAADGSLVYSLLRTQVSIARLAFGGQPVRAIHGVGSDRMPRPDPSGARIAFVSRRGGPLELWLASPDGSAARALTTLGGIVESPAWSPKGDRLAFIGSCGPDGRIGLCTVRAEGDAPQPLSTDAADYAEPTWHPRRDEIWVASDRASAWQLWRFPAAGGAGIVEPTEMAPGRSLQWLADGSGFVYQPRGENHLRWRTVAGPAAGHERRIDVATKDEELVDWRVGDGTITTLTRSDLDRWRRIQLASGRRQALGELALGTLPERARFSLAGADAVWVEVANTQVGDLMQLR